MGHPGLSCRRALCAVCCALAAAGCAPAVDDRLPAFPGAEGFGRYAAGGRGGDVYFVTQLGDDGPGSLRHGIESAEGPRTILFRVSGMIRLASELRVERPNLTIAGQTAPGGGIGIRDYTLVLAADHLVVRHLRCRLGTDGGLPEDAVSLAGGDQVMVDHCSASWSVDETFSLSGRARRATVQWCYITEALHDSIHPKGAHGFGSLIRARSAAQYSLHHNLYAHHASRNPRPGSYPGGSLLLDFCNNLVYDWGYKAGYSGGAGELADINYRGNYLVAGPSTTWMESAFEGGSKDTRIYQEGNRFDVNTNGVPDGVDRGWAQFDGDLTRVDAPFPVPAVALDGAGAAYRRVLSLAGATPWLRDGADARVTAQVLAEAGRIVHSVAEAGGWPELASGSAPPDADDDGMPDAWERALGHDPAQADHHGDADGDGYTNLEGYLNWLGGPHAMTSGSTPIDIDLRRFTTGFPEPDCGVVRASGGKAALLPGGAGVRFVPQDGFAGVAGLDFSTRRGEDMMHCTIQVLVVPE